MEILVLKDLTDYLIRRVEDVVYYSFHDEYNKVLKGVTNGQAVTDVQITAETVLRQFQEKLMMVDVWEVQRFYSETERVMDKMHRLTLRDVLSEIIFYHSLVFCKTKNNLRVIEQVPLRVKEIDFVKLLYETVAKLLYKNPGLYDKFAPPEHRMKNVGEIYKLIDRATRDTLLAFVPLDELTQIPFKFPPKVSSKTALHSERQQEDQRRKLLESNKKQHELEKEIGRLRLDNENLSKKIEQIFQDANAKLVQGDTVTSHPSHPNNEEESSNDRNLPDTPPNSEITVVPEEGSLENKPSQVAESAPVPDSPAENKEID